MASSCLGLNNRRIVHKTRSAIQQSTSPATAPNAAAPKDGCCCQLPSCACFLSPRSSARAGLDLVAAQRNKICPTPTSSQLVQVAQPQLEAFDQKTTERSVSMRLRTDRSIEQCSHCAHAAAPKDGCCCQLPSCACFLSPRSSARAGLDLVAAQRNKICPTPTSSQLVQVAQPQLGAFDQKTTERSVSIRYRARRNPLLI